MADLVLANPVEAGEARVEDAVGHVAGHLLRADQHALDLGVVDGGEVGARRDQHLEARPLEELDGGLLERALGNAEPQLHRAAPAAPAAGCPPPVSGTSV
ncbi:MAG: hypothetical protein R2712_10325 [Vicinamibacterales bacterium]